MLVVDVVDDESVVVIGIDSDNDGLDGRVTLDEHACGGFSNRLSTDAR